MIRTTEDAERWLFDAIEAMDDDDSDAPYAVSTYEDAGVLTRDRGLVLRFASGLEVQVTIVRSANATDVYETPPDVIDAVSGAGAFLPSAWDRLIGNPRAEGE